MSTLLNNNNLEGGYRLRSLEIYNWGTFHGKVFKLQPNGRTSLLTGANGSGKTTLIDALLTLMVPSNKRFYNQSSGAEAKKERDESSYFWGYFGKTYSDEEERATTEQLRTKTDNPYSVLLACFQNSATQHTVTLIQLRWFSNGSLKKVYVVAPYQLNINDHFGKDHFDMKGDWKKKLQKQYPKTDLFDSFKDYAARFSEMFGLKEKALPLFNQTVGIKVLGDLTQFIRQQMLEEPDAEEQFKSLLSHYTDLLISHKAIQKDEKQLELLEPIVDNKARLEDLKQNLSVLQLIQKQVQFFFNKQEYELLEIHLRNLDDRIAALNLEKKHVDGLVLQLEQEQVQLIAQKAQMNIDGQVQLLKKDIQTETEKRDKKKESFDDYFKVAKTLGLQTDIHETAFQENYKSAVVLENKLQVDYDELTETRTKFKIDLETTNSRINEIQEEITSLLGRKNRIPRELIAVREQLIDLLETGENDLPFVGELIKVNEQSSHWEDVIERVLHGFSMQLLVPEKYVKQVNHFVHTKNLQTKLVYQKIERKSSDALIRWPTDEDALINKIEIRELDSFTKWIEYQLFERFNYYCTDDLEVFYGSSKAVTSNGLIRNINRHEKDDRHQYWNKSKYRLGWDNKESILFLQDQKLQLERNHKEVSGKIDALVPKISSIKGKLPLLALFTAVKSYNDINWKSHAEKIQFLTNQIDDLTKSNDKYQTILKQLEEVETTLGSHREKSQEIGGEVKSLGRESKEKSKHIRTIQYDELSSEGSSLITDFIAKESIKAKLPENLEQLDSFKNEFSKILHQKSTLAATAVQTLELEAISNINAFIHPEGKILNEFPEWSGDVDDIPASLKSLNQLEDLYKTIRNQRLVEHKRRFQEYMDRSMLDALTNFRTWLVNEEEKIKEVIDELNVPLQKITFNKNPDTYLQLEYKATKDQEIKAFKEQLSATIPNTLEFTSQKDESYRQVVFEKIKSLITELQKEEAWRRKVTDIRNWLIFSAREYSVVDNKAGQYHDNTASYSGGQKAQFTYAILGAAISHQFGIYQAGKQHRSLRFITVDEAFSKLDPEKSQFLMEFCEQLHLQLLVVTPLDKINIAEPFIHAVHFVEIKNKKHSIVYNLSMQEYQERKEEFKQLAKLEDDNA